MSDLSALATLLSPHPPDAKGELVALLAEHLEGARLHAVWKRLDDLQRAAVAEAVHTPDGRFRPARFRAKCGSDPELQLTRTACASRGSPRSTFPTSR